jgi:hypothetical protein
VKEEKTKPIAFAEINLDEITETTTPPRQIHLYNIHVVFNPGLIEFVDWRYSQSCWYL